MAKFKCTNGDCERHGEEIYFMHHRSKIKDGGPIYMDGQFRQLVCSDKSTLDKNGEKMLISNGCGNALEFVQPNHDGFPQVRTQTFNSLSNSDKKKVLLKREKAHSKTNKPVKEYKEAVNRGEIKP